MNDGAPGKDEITIKLIKNFHATIEFELARKIQKMAESHPDELENILNEGVVIPLFKDMGN